MRVLLYSAAGVEFDLTSDGPVFIPEGGLETLTGVLSRTDRALPGRSGVRVGRTVVGPIQTSFPAFIHETPGMSFGQAWSAWVSAWSTDPERSCTLRVEDMHPLGALSLSLFLDQPLPGAPKDLRDLDSHELAMPVFGPEGVFWGDVITLRDFVTVTNAGDVDVYPSIVWSGPGGEVVVPSGAMFTLPAVDGERRLLLDDQESCVVLGMDDEVDWATSALVSHLVFAEPVPPGQSREWALPAGAYMQYQLGVLNPWRGIE